LESAGEQDYSLHKARNPARTEAWAEARDLDSRTRAIWEKHPRMHVVPNQRAFSDKIFAVLKLVENCLKS
jgi:hypothetical protein